MSCVQHSADSLHHLILLDDKAVVVLLLLLFVWFFFCFLLHCSSSCHKLCTEAHHITFSFIKHMNMYSVYSDKQHLFFNKFLKNLSAEASHFMAVLCITLCL